MDTNSEQFDLSTASYRRSAKDQTSYIEALAIRLEESLPDLVQVMRKNSLFSKKKPVTAIEVSIDPKLYKLNIVKGNKFDSQIGSVVRGICLKTKTVSFTEWLNSLLKDIEKYATIHACDINSLQEFLV